MCLRELQVHDPGQGKSMSRGVGTEKTSWVGVKDFHREGGTYFRAPWGRGEMCAITWRVSCSGLETGEADKGPGQDTAGTTGGCAGSRLGRRPRRWRGKDRGEGHYRQGKD